MKRLALAVLLIGAGGAGWVRWRYQVTREVSPYDLAVRSVDENATQARRLGGSAISVGPLRAIIRPPATGHAWFVYWGGNTSTYFQESLDTVVGLELPPDIGVLVVAPPGYDGSEGHPTPENVTQAATVVRDWLVREQKAERIVTGGFSMGALSALVAATDAHVVATVLLASFTVFETGDPSRWIRLREPVRYFPPSPFPKVKALVLHGANDDGFLPQMGRDVAAGLGAEFVLVPGTGHAELQTSAPALSRARAFIVTALQPAS